MCTTTRAWLLRGGVVGVLAAASWVGPATAHAAELGDTVWIPMVDPAKGAAETFELNTLGIIREGDVAWRIFRGKYRESVSRHDFFVTVGRPDLDHQESSRQAKHAALLAGGVAGVIAGAWVTGAGLSKGGWDPPLALGLGLMAGGAIAYWVSDVFSGPALSADEAESLIRRYNERLRDRLEEEEPAEHDNRIQARQEVRRELHLMPWIAQGSGGLGVAARF